MFVIQVRVQMAFESRDPRNKKQGRNFRWVFRCGFLFPVDELTRSVDLKRVTVRFNHNNVARR